MFSSGIALGVFDLISAAPVRTLLPTIRTWRGVMLVTMGHDFEAIVSNLHYGGVGEPVP